MHSIKDNRSAGFTLIELMMALAITGIITAAMVSVFQAQVRGQVAQDVSLEMTQSVRAAMEIMGTDIRMAGCDPTEDAGAEIVSADIDDLTISMDIRGDAIGDPPEGATDDAGEIVRYAINASGNLGRSTSGGNLEPLHSIDMACDVLDFVYLDEDGNPLGVPVADTDDIRAIQVSIIIRSADVANPGLLRAFTDNNSYINLQGDEILAPPNDTFRRFQLSETIRCRNL